MGHCGGIDAIIKVTECAAGFAEVEGVWQPKYNKGFALLVQMIEGFLYMNLENMLLMYMRQ